MRQVGVRYDSMEDLCERGRLAVSFCTNHFRSKTTCLEKCLSDDMKY